MNENARTIRSVRAAGALFAGTLLAASPAIGQVQALRSADGGLKITSKQEKAASSRGRFTKARAPGRLPAPSPARPADDAPGSDDVRGPDATIRIWSGSVRSARPPKWTTC